MTDCLAENRLLLTMLVIAVGSLLGCLRRTGELVWTPSRQVRGSLIQLGLLLFLAGVLAGAQTQPAVLGMADDRTGHDPRVGMGYAAAYPVAMILKIVLAQALLI